MTSLLIHILVIVVALTVNHVFICSRYRIHHCKLHNINYVSDLNELKFVDFGREIETCTEAQKCLFTHVFFFLLLLFGEKLVEDD